MKKLLFIFLFLFLFESVSAKEDVQFYYGTDKVESMWITRVKGDIVKSSNPYILRRKNDNSYVYCLQPIVLLNQEEDYTAYYTNHKVFNISDEDWERISNLAYFGYFYPGHEDKKWYGITQYLIWKTVAKDMDIYFSDGKNGKKINAYQKEIEEIESLIQNYQSLKNLNHKKLSFKNVEEWNNWKSGNIILKNAIMPLNDTYAFELPENAVTFGVDTFYYHKSGQNVYHPGRLLHMNLSFDVEFLKGKINLKKKNKEDTFISNDNCLKGASYGIYKDGILIETIETDEEGNATSSLLEYGTYTIKEIKASPGYEIDDTVYTVFIDAEDISLEVYEEQKMNKLKIEKWYGSGKYKLESDAIFEIYQGDDLILTVKTDTLGIAEFSLPYGRYRLHQVKGKEGYQNIQDLDFTVTDNSLNHLKLYNEEIIVDVPDTGLLTPFSWVRIFEYVRSILSAFKLS